MNQSNKLKIIKLIESPSSKLLEYLYSLNQENTPEVGSLNDAKSFRKLFELSSNSLLIEYKNQVIGFMICFRENSIYDSENYMFFNDKKKKFLYIDRVVIKSDYRRMGFGTRVYKYLDKVAAKESLPICCEVNSIPLNQISFNFHAKNGFIMVGERDFKDHSVRYLQK